MGFIRTEISTSFAFVSLMSVMLKTEFAFFAVWARAFPLSDSATFHSPTSFVKPLAIRPVASSSKVHVRLPPSWAKSGVLLVASTTPASKNRQLAFIAVSFGLGALGRSFLASWCGRCSQLRLHRRYEGGTGPEDIREGTARLVEFEEVIRRQPPGPQPLAKRVEGPRVEAPLREHRRCPLE